MGQLWSLPDELHSSGILERIGCYYCWTDARRNSNGSSCYFSGGLGTCTTISHIATTRFCTRRAQHAPGRPQLVVAAASGGARSQIAAAPLYADERTEGVKTASGMACTGGGAREFYTRTGHERGRRLGAGRWSAHMRGAGSIFQS